VAALRGELQRSGLRERDPDAYRQRAFELSVAGYFADPRRAHDLTPFKVTGRVQQSVWSSLGDYDLRATLESVRVPTLVVHGRQDPIPLLSSESAARALGASCVVLDDCGHVPYVEQPERLFDALQRFHRERPARNSLAS
jgi:proline iminopeptidase